jgi:Mrp family chromosome partitioning ATPase
MLEPGLLDVLDGQADLSDVILQTSIDKLTLIPSGAHRRDATELLASDAMSRLLAEMTSRYEDRIIVFDSPPLLLTTEARVLAAHMGQVVVVVHAEKTPQAKVESALGLIDACPVRLLVLNHARDAVDTSYGYGYGYGAKGASTATEAPPGKA